MATDENRSWLRNAPGMSYAWWLEKMPSHAREGTLDCLVPIFMAANLRDEGE